MIRILLIILVALLLGTGLALGLQYDLGYIRISLGNYLIETNFWIGLALLVLLVAASRANHQPVPSIAPWHRHGRRLAGPQQ